MANPISAPNIGLSKTAEFFRSGQGTKCWRTQGIDYVRNSFNCIARADVAWISACLASQQEMGLWSDRRTGLGSGDFDHSRRDRQNLTLFHKKVLYAKKYQTALCGQVGRIRW